jgi:hypothetical protein
MDGFLRLRESGAVCESELLAKIDQGLPGSFWQRKKALDERADAFQLTEAEYEERVALQSELERWHLDRMQCVLELAQLRGENPHALLKCLSVSVPVS